MMRFLIILFFSKSALFAQIEVFKMRSDFETFQKKWQTRGEVSQNLQGVSKDSIWHQFDLENLSLLQKNSAFFLSQSKPLEPQINYRGFASHQIGMAIDGHQIELSALNTNSLLPFFTLGVFNKLEIAYGQNSLTYSQNTQGGILNFFSSRSPIFNEKYEDLSAVLGYNLNSKAQTVSIQFQKSNHKWQNQTRIFYQKADAYTIGASLNDQYGTFGQQLFLDNEKGSVNSNPHQIPNASYQMIQVLQKYSLFFNKRNHINFLAFVSTLDDNLSPMPWDYSCSPTSAQNRPIIFGKLDAVWYQDEGFFSKLNAGVMYSGFEKSDNYLSSNNQYWNHFISNYSLKGFVDMYKNINSKWILFANANLVGQGLSMNHTFMDVNTNSSSFKDIIQANLSSKLEYRHSDNVSYLFGFRVGSQQVNLPFNYKPLLIQIPTENYYKQNLLNYTAYLTWARHSCESNNYSASLFYTKRNSSVYESFSTDFVGLISPYNDLKSEEILGVESHFYKKLDDQLEVQFSPFAHLFFNKISNGITNINDTIRLGNQRYFEQDRKNIKNAFSIGGSLDIKYHLSNRLLIYMVGHFMKSQTSENQTLENTPPIYGSFGFKANFNTSFFHFWMFYNATKNVNDMGYLNHIQNQNAAFINNQLFGNPGFAVFNFQWIQKIHSKMDVSFQINNLLNQNYRAFQSERSGLGRNVQMNIQLKL
jgi:hypothetical protein